MATTIKIKNSNVGGKVPAAGSLESAELALNLKDRKLYSKDADGNVFEIGNAANVPGGGTPPGSGNEIGDLFFDTVNNILLYWDGSEWLPVVDGDSIALGELSDVEVDGVVDGQVLIYDAGAGAWVPADPESLSVDVDLDYTPATDKGTITNTAGDDAEIPLVDETNAGLMSPGDYKKLSEMPGFISGNTQPGNPSPGDIWIDTSDCPPTINVWDDCDDPGNPTWKPIGGGGGGGCVQGPVSIVSSNGTELGSTLTAVGGNGVDEGTGLTATYEWTGAKTGNGNTIVADVEGDYTVTATITCVDGSTLSDSTVWTVSDSYVDMVNNTPPVIAVVGEGPDGAYEGNSIYVVTPATVINGINPVIVENRWFVDGSDAGTDQLYQITASDVVGSVVTCRQLFRDARTNEILSDESNSITIVARPAGAITFAAVITDDGTPNANTPGHVLTASAQNIQGGDAPIEYAYEWKVEGLTMGGNKTLNIIQTFVGKIVTCEITVAEPDGTNPETRTAVYDKIIEVAGTINTPSVLEPEDGAGSGSARYLKSDTIIEVEGGGIDVCETDLIESVVGAFEGRTWTGNPVDPNNFFDGNPDARTAANAGASATATFATPIKMPSIYLLGRSPQNNHTISVNTDVGDVPLIYQGDWADSSISPSYPGQWFADGFTEINSITFGDSGNANWTIAGFQENNPGSGTNLLKDEDFVLTFPSSNGFDCFEPGDVVQGIDSTGAYKTYSFPTNTQPPVDAKGTWTLIEETSIAAGPQKSENHFGFIYELDVPVSELHLGFIPDNQAGLVLKLWGSNDATTWTTLDCINTGTSGSGVYADSGSTPYKYFCFAKISEAGETGLCSNGTNTVTVSMNNASYGILTNQNPAVKVISKDEDANTITVDGGDWSDGTSEPGTDQTQVWSKQVSLTPADVQYLSGKGPEMAFNNDFSNYNYTTVQAYAGTSTIRVEFNPSLSGELIVFGDTNLDPVKQTVVVTADTGGGTFADSMTTNVAENTITTVTNCTAIEVSQSLSQSPGGVDTQVMLKGIKVGGDILFDASGDTKLVKQTPYDTKLTVAGPTDLADMTGSVLMTDGTGAPGPFTQTPYKLVTTDIESANEILPDWVARVETDAPGGFNPTYPAANAVDGSTTTFADANPLGSYSQVNLSELYPPGTYTLETRSGGASACDFITDTGTTTIDNPSKALRTYSATVTGTPLYIRLRTVDGDAASIYYFKINDEIITNGSTAPRTVLTFPGDVSTNPDLQYFKASDVVQTTPNEVKVISTGYPDSNTMLVDGGEWDTSNQSQVWSDVLTSDNGFLDPATNAFDSDTTTKASSNSSGTLTFSPNLTVPANSTIEMYLGRDPGSTFEMTVNVDGVENVINGGGFLPVPYNNGTTINTITVKRANAANSAEIRGIKINGRTLIDTRSKTVKFGVPILQKTSQVKRLLLICLMVI